MDLDDGKRSGFCYINVGIRSSPLGTFILISRRSTLTSDGECWKICCIFNMYFSVSFQLGHLIVVASEVMLISSRRSLEGGFNLSSSFCIFCWYYIILLSFRTNDDRVSKGNKKGKFKF